jgi:hypothetical protein
MIPPTDDPHIRIRRAGPDSSADSGADHFVQQRLDE